jgi:hypothetical protein
MPALGFAELQRDELGRVARLHPQEHRALPSSGFLEDATHIGRLGDLLAADLEDDVAGLKPCSDAAPLGS